MQAIQASKLNPSNMMLPNSTNCILIYCELIHKCTQLKHISILKCQVMFFKRQVILSNHNHPTHKTFRRKQSINYTLITSQMGVSYMNFLYLFQSIQILKREERELFQNPQGSHPIFIFYDRLIRIIYTFNFNLSCLQLITDLVRPPSGNFGTNSVKQSLVKFITNQIPKITTSKYMGPAAKCTLRF